MVIRDLITKLQLVIIPHPHQHTTISTAMNTTIIQHQVHQQTTMIISLAVIHTTHTTTLITIVTIKHTTNLNIQTLIKVNSNNNNNNININHKNNNHHHHHHRNLVTMIITMMKLMIFISRNLNSHHDHPVSIQTLTAHSIVTILKRQNRIVRMKFNI
jgi:hypothetical protein